MPGAIFKETVPCFVNLYDMMRRFTFYLIEMVAIETAVLNMLKDRIAIAIVSNQTHQPDFDVFLIR